MANQDHPQIPETSLVICGVYNTKAPHIESGGKIGDDDQYVVFTREEWLKFQNVIDETGTRAAFKAAGAFMCPISSDGVLNHKNVRIRVPRIPE